MLHSGVQYRSNEAGERSIFATFANFAVHVFKHLTAKDAKIAKKYLQLPGCDFSDLRPVPSLTNTI
jgi:hypothetical protein